MKLELFLPMLAHRAFQVVIANGRATILEVTLGELSARCRQYPSGVVLLSECVCGLRVGGVNLLLSMVRLELGDWHANSTTIALLLVLVLVVGLGTIHHHVLPLVHVEGQCG